MNIYNNLPQETRELFLSIIIDELDHNCLLSETISDRYGDLNELHSKCFNEDYFIVGYYEANKFIEENFASTFEAIDIVKQYEIDNFGEFKTSIDSESICNMLAYIIGEEIIYELNEDSDIKETIECLKNL